MADDVEYRPKAPTTAHAKKVMRDQAAGDSESALKTASLAYDPEWKKQTSKKTSAEAEKYAKHQGITRKHYKKLSDMKGGEEAAFKSETDRWTKRYVKASGLEGRTQKVSSRTSASERKSSRRKRATKR